MRITGHPVLPDLPADEVGFTFNGEPYTAREGEPVAATLLANGVRQLRVSPVAVEPRGIYCGIGHCYECRVWLNNDTQVRACLTPATEGDSFASERTEE
ncbi:(2Fe-2S)-binding protein [Cryobacterium tagatosivorans]|uniref:(2Fe-2S)-binding protein n=1 Tax=Cryobacterium tagatosivorans TaxID=1259199 RepID=A0A4R8UHI2_9MICO|nr:(2Fe-2S)-binding protein [Cryobacterium tagatosivorans]TFB56305.1 (2Fe-2S)-binding protein [Cryobacterium tagatosivorans]